MSRIFNDLDLEVIYVNEQLSKGRSLTKIAVEDYGYKSESSLRKRLTKDNLYKRYGQKFIKLYESNINDNKNDFIVRQSVGQYVTNLKEEESSEIVDVTMSHEDRHIIIDDRVEGLLANYDILMNIINEYKNSNKRVGNGKLIIELPPETEEARITFRINKTIYEEFRKFAECNKQFKVKELVSAALYEFVNKYK